MYGAGVCILGVVVTVVTMSMASAAATYVVHGELLFFGAIQFFRGLIQSAK